MNNDYEKINEYLDWYEALLTEKQRDIMNMYYREDFSLSEIAENLNISRSAVSDLIKRVSKSLEDYENKLQLVSKFHFRVKCYNELNETKIEEVIEIVKKLNENE